MRIDCFKLLAWTAAVAFFLGGWIMIGRVAYNAGYKAGAARGFTYGEKIERDAADRRAQYDENAMNLVAGACR